ncbi:MAG TPA: NAD(P)-dependent oxidoreductase [Terriglobales bacterium]|nr:NAD(P)-dependent oxidoreductase [Terriglobales bacterium]
MSFPTHKGDPILVTGGEGFIGQHVRKALTNLGTRVVSVDRRSAGADRPGQCYDCDIRDADRINEIVGSHKIAGIIHLASLLRTASERDPLSATQVNIIGSLNILEAARAFKVQRVVYASSASVYGTRGAEDKAREEDVTAPEDVYGNGKKYVEMLGEAYRRAYGIEFIALRVPIVVGPGSMDTASPWRSEIFSLADTSNPRAISIPFQERETISLVHAEDLAQQFATLVHANRPSFSVYNAACEIWTVRDLKKEVESLNGNLGVNCADAAVSGFARVMDAERFTTEFNYSPTALKDRLRAAFPSAK